MSSIPVQGNKILYAAQYGQKVKIKNNFLVKKKDNSSNWLLNIHLKSIEDISQKPLWDSTAIPWRPTI